MSRLFDRYDSAAFARMFQEVGVFESLSAKGFSGFAVAVDDTGLAIPHVRLSAEKAGHRHRLLDACLRRVVVPVAGRDGDRARHIAPGGPLDLLFVQWVREEDPTAPFAAGRPPLPLQNHPGLGVLRRAFRVAVRIASELGTDGVASQPKFFHDAVIFYRSRLFLFLDGREQGRFEALQRDLNGLPLRDATVAVAGWCVRDEREQVVRWRPGYQVFPISPRLAAHFHAPQYAADVAAARGASRFRIDADALAAARLQLGTRPA